MVFSTRAFKQSALLLCLTLLPVSRTEAAEPEGVKFDTVDHVTLTGSYYASPKGKKAPTVLLLHDFDVKKGGSSKADGFDSLAKALQAKGFAVLTFDFRGHGDSKTVGEKFWMAPQNRLLPGARASRPPTSINQSDFSPRYYPNLLNDIAAAKAYLDRENDSENLNSKNLIVIGAGEGATLGALWMSTEFKRYRATVTQNVKGPLFPPTITVADNPEGKDIMCGVWLNMKSTLAGQNIYNAVHKSLTDVAMNQKIPMAFLYGKDDETAAKDALGYLKSSVPGFQRGKKPKDEDYLLTGEFPVPGTKLASTKLLQDTLETGEWIVTKYLQDQLIEKKKISQWEAHKNDDALFFWLQQKGAKPIDAKAAGEKVSRPLPVMALLGIYVP